MDLRFSCTDLSNAKSAFDHFGVVVIANALSHDNIHALKHHLSLVSDRLRIDNAALGSHINYCDPNKSIVNSLHRLEELNDPSLNSLGQDSILNSIAFALLGEKPLLFSMQAFLKPPGFGLAAPLHQDNAYWNRAEVGGITLWIALDKCGKLNGMIKYAVFGNYDLLPHRTSNDTPGSSLVISDSDISPDFWFQPELEPGDVVIHHGLVPHKSDANTSQLSRRGFLINYRSSKHLLNEDKFAAYKSNLESIYDRV